MKERGESQIISAAGFMPVDIAGFMKSKRVVEQFVEYVEINLEEEH